ncbi:MAG: GNAT family N-acetyltransferase [Flavobacteriaceae bacterium]
MGLIHRCKQGLFMLLHRYRQWPHYLSELKYDPGQTPLLPDTFDVYTDNFSVLSLRLVPEYFNCRIEEEKLLIQKIKHHNWGYAIKLNNCESAREYLRRQFNSTARRTILRYIKRLEHCLDINYELHFGEIEKDHYDNLMNRLHHMFVTRFNMKGERHKELPYWDQIRANTFDQIKRKEASLFVIYHDQKPIEISLNYHLGKMLFSYISSFDMDYAKFGLGHVEIFKQLEWCLNNDYIIYDMGVGGTDYKRRWSNYIYQFEHHILYPRAGLLNRLAAYGEIFRVRLKEFVKSIGINEIPQKFSSLRLPQKPITQDLIISPIHKSDKQKESPSQTEQMQSILKDSESFQLIKKQLNNFLYSTQEQEKDIIIWQPEANVFRIEGKEHYQLLEVIPESEINRKENHKTAI